MSATRSEASPTPLVEVSHLQKSFGATKALIDCTFDIAPGEIRAILGENGSGKSTLVKILSGVLKPDGGTFTLGGKPGSFRSPREAQRAGIVTVFQETLIAPELSVLDNIFLGTDGLLRWGSPHAEQRRTAHAALAALDAGTIDLDAPLEALPLHRRQIVTLARAFVRPWRLLILDEATSALDVGSRDALFHYLRHHAPAEAAVLFITHRMDEIANLAASVTVLQSGETTATLPIADAPAELLVNMISRTRAGPGASISAPKVVRAAEASAHLRAEGVVLRPGAEPIDLDVRPGEIIGLSGLDGHGQAEFLSVIAGLRSSLGGRVEVGGDGEWTSLRSMRQAVQHGICYVPRDRKTDGLFAGLSVLDNYAMPSYWRNARLSFISPGALRGRADRDLGMMHTRYAHLGMPVGRLSGGNQQKVLLARWLALKPRVMVLDDPLRGVDAATKLEVYDVFRSLAAGGVSLLFLSTEIEELLMVCGRIVVFREAQVARNLEGVDMTRDAVVAAMFGQRDAASQRETAGQ